MHEERIGLHALSFEPPDLVRCVIQGDISADEMRRMIAYVRACAEERAPVLFLADIAGLGAIPPDTRKEVRATVGIPYGAIAAHSATFQTKILASMILGAMKLLSGERTPVAFFGTEAEARRWLEAERAALAPAVRRG